MRRARFLSLAVIAVLTAALLAGCGGWGAGNAVLGPNPGGGFYCPHNIYEGCAYP
jgi:hypothetical protein